MLSALRNGPDLPDHKYSDNLLDLKVKEILITIALLFILASVSAASSTRIGRVISYFDSLQAALNEFRIDVGRYPSTEEGLDALLESSNISKTNPGGYIRYISKDPWGYEYHYMFPGAKNTGSFDLWSYGADGLLGGDGFDSDVGNWPGGLDKQYSALANFQNKKTLKVLPSVSILGLVLCGILYVGISKTRLSAGVELRKSYIGKSIWIPVLFFVFYLVLVLPLVAR